MTRDRDRVSAQSARVPLFIDGSVGRVFAIYRPAAAPRRPRRSLLVLPPFAEEMNKTRRMVTLLAERAQECGIDTLVPDLTGTGDSAGELRDATTDIWRGDLEICVRWLVERGVEALDVLAVRFGGLLLDQLRLDDAVTPGRLVLWQPIASGRLLVSQFLRLRFAAGLIDGAGSVDSSNLRDTLRREGSLQIAGYDLSDELACALEALELGAQPVRRFERVSWFEVAAEEASDVGPAATRIVSAWRAAGTRVSSRTLAGDPFWATTEIATVPALIDATLAALDDAVVAA